MEKNGVKLVGIGLEELGAEDFADGNFLAGDVFVDEKKQCYQDLGFRRCVYCYVYVVLLIVFAISEQI